MKSYQPKYRTPLLSKRKTYAFITRTDPTPQALKQATLAGMIQRRKEREARAAHQRKRALRMTAAAAALILAVTATPLRGYAVHAAEYVYQTIVGNWKQDVFPVNVKQSDHGCTVEIVEARLANDFLYLTVKEYYPKEMVTRDSDTELYTLPDIRYSGSITDHQGGTLAFGSDNIVCLWAIANDHRNYQDGYEERTVTQSKEQAEENKDSFAVNAQYRVYLPTLASVVNAADKHYSCTLKAVSSAMGSELHFDFPLENVAEAIDSQTFDLNRTFALDGASVTLQKLAFSISGADLIVKIDPDPALSPDEAADWLDGFEASVMVRNDSDAAQAANSTSDKSKPSAEETPGFAWLSCDHANGHGFVYDFEEDLNADSLTRNQNGGMKLGDSYYLVLSDFAESPDSSYQMDRILRSDFTVEVEYLRCRSSLPQRDPTDMLTHYYSLPDVALRPEKVKAGRYTFAPHQIPLPGDRGNLEIALKEITETDSEPLADGRFRHILDVDADMTVENWDGMAKDGTWENLTLVNSSGATVLTVSLQLDTCDSVAGTYRPDAVKCEVTDDNQHFTLSDSVLYVAKVTETQSYEPNGWFNARFCQENTELLNEQRFFRFHR